MKDLGKFLSPHGGGIRFGTIGRRPLLALGGLGVGAVALAACGGGGSGGGQGDGGQQAEIGVLPAEGTSGHEFIVAIGNSITERKPEFTYEYAFVNSKVRPQIEQRWRAGTPPDTDYFVFNAQVPSTHEFTPNLLELSPYLDEEIEGGGTWRESFLDSTSAVTDLDGKTYGVVTDTHLIALFYNKQIFDDLGLQPPETWDDLLAVSEEISLGLSSLRCPRGGRRRGKVLLTWKNRACLGSNSPRSKEHLQGEHYRVVSAGAG